MMNEVSEDRAGELKATWLGWAWVFPQLMLAGLNWYAWILVRGDMTPAQHTRALYIGLFEVVLLGSGCLGWLARTIQRKPIGIGLALAALAGHIGYLWFIIQSMDNLLPSSVTLWMLPQTELIFYQFSLIMPVVFLMLVRLSRIRLGISTRLDVGLSLASLIMIPAGVFILGSAIARIGRFMPWRDSYQYLLIAAMVAATAFILVAFLRLMIRLHDLIQRHSWSTWAIPLAAGLVAPLSGLALNASIPFPYDFQDPAVYLLTLLNGGALLIPFRPGTRWALPGWIARAMLYPFTVYFFLVFLPFLPLSLLAMIAAGAGFLILAPVLLFTVHTRRLWEQARQLAGQYGAVRVAAMFVACLLVIPTSILTRDEGDRRTLNQAINVVFSPDFAVTRIVVRDAPLRRALDRMDDMKHGIYLPYLSDIYDAMVFRGMVLPDEKAELIRKSLLGASPDVTRRSSLWDNGFLGRGNRNGRRTRGAGVADRNVVVASHEEVRRQTNGMVETEIQLVLENRGVANSEFSQQITVPEGALVTGFWLEVSGTNKTAQLRERKAATWVYEMIRDMTRRDPGLLVYEDDQHLRLRVYPFAAGEKRRCGLRFRFPTAMQPSVRLQDTTIVLDSKVGADLRAASEPQEITPDNDRARRSRSTTVSSILPGGVAALVVPASTMTNWPSFRREVVAHLILDQSERASNLGGTAFRARAAIQALPPSITRFRLTWANYEQEDLPGEPLSRDEALRALNHVPTLPTRGGFCAERVIARVLMSQENSPRAPGPAGYAPLFVVIPTPGSIPVRAINLAPFARLAPDLPLYAVFDATGLTPVTFKPSGKDPLPLTSLTPKDIVLLRNGTKTIPVAADTGALVMTPANQASSWEIWQPSAGQFQTLETPTPCMDPAYQAGLSLWARHRTLSLTPGLVDAALPDLIKSAREAGLLIPEAALIVLETRSQDVMLARKEQQSLAANHALEFDEARTDKAPAPPAVWLILPVIWLFWRQFSRSRIV